MESEKPSAGPKSAMAARVKLFQLVQNIREPLNVLRQPQPRLDRALSERHGLFRERLRLLVEVRAMISRVTRDFQHALGGADPSIVVPRKEDVARSDASVFASADRLFIALERLAEFKKDYATVGAEAILDSVNGDHLKQTYFAQLRALESGLEHLHESLSRADVGPHQLPKDHKPIPMPVTPKPKSVKTYKMPPMPTSAPVPMPVPPPAPTPPPAPPAPEEPLGPEAQAVVDEFRVLQKELGDRLRESREFRARMGIK